MNRISMYLPPFSGDYSGVCSDLFDLGGMVCLHDAAGCTGNYTHFDEPRWYGSDSMVYCTKFRKLDAVLGNDDHTIRKIEAAAKELHPRFIAIVGSPVPNVIGFDFHGVARAVEAHTGIPSFGFATAGIRGSYRDGIVQADLALTARFAAEAEAPVERIVHILGATPLDLDQAVFDHFRSVCKRGGWKLELPPQRYNSMEQIQHPRRAVLNLAPTQAGEELAARYEEKYGTPYVSGFPLGSRQEEKYLACLEKAAGTGTSCRFPEKEKEKTGQHGKALVIADAVTARSVCELLGEAGYDGVSATVSGRAGETCRFLSGEEEILEAVNDPAWDLVAADPLILGLVESSRVGKLALPWWAVSSRTTRHDHWDITDDAMWRTRLEEAAALPGCPL
ncbi:MAG: nitrogenase component 1 [Lachnospiraceae bacterium]